jgi:hypothetical protein
VFDRPSVDSYIYWFLCLSILLSVRLYVVCLNVDPSVSVSIRPSFHSSVAPSLFAVSQLILPSSYLIGISQVDTSERGVQGRNTQFCIFIYFRNLSNWNNKLLKPLGNSFSLRIPEHWDHFLESLSGHWYLSTWVLCPLPWACSQRRPNFLCNEFSYLS